MSYSSRMSERHLCASCHWLTGCRTFDILGSDQLNQRWRRPWLRLTCRGTWNGGIRWADLQTDTCVFTSCSVCVCVCLTRRLRENKPWVFLDCRTVRAPVSSLCRRRCCGDAGRTFSSALQRWEPPGRSATPGLLYCVSSGSAFPRVIYREKERGKVEAYSSAWH